MVDFQLYTYIRQWGKGKEKPRREYQGCKSGAPTGMRDSR